MRLEGERSRTYTSASKPFSDCVMANVISLFESKPSRAGRPNDRVLLVGAGPGDPGLLTRKAYAALQAADVLFYDDLVSAEILAEVPASVRRVYVGKPKGTAKVTQ